jgi:hypothetical protein
MGIKSCEAVSVGERERLHKFCGIFYGPYLCCANPSERHKIESYRLCAPHLAYAKVNKVARRGFSTLCGSHMVKINEELKAAKAAKAAIKATSTSPKSAVLATLNKANHAAILNLSNGGALNEARGNVGIALSSVLHSQPTPEKIDKAKRAIEAWIKELEASPAA